MLIIDQTTTFPAALAAVNGCVSFGIRLGEEFHQSNWFMPELYVDSEEGTTILLEWSEEESGPAAVCMRQRVIPHCRALLPFPIDPAHFYLESTFLPPFSALRKGSVNGKPIDKSRLKSVKITLKHPALRSVTLYGVRMAKERPRVELSGEPLVDRFGQAIHGEWENKVTSEEELVRFLRGEYERAKRDCSYPEGWSEWGGWKKKNFGGTGWFRLAHDGKRHWLVDPDGCAFFSNGMCYGERAGIFGFTDEYTGLHEWLPDESGDFADAWCDASNIPQYIVRHGRAGADKRKMFNFSRANLIRAFGNRWHEAYTTITAARLRRMGFNTIGVGTNDYFNERTHEFLDAAKIPYVVTFRTFPRTKERIFRDFPDVYSEEYRMLCREFAVRELEPYRKDPYLIGYFVTNEPEWLFAGSVNLAERLLAANGCIASKRMFIERMQKKYGCISSLNAAWGTDFADFDVFLGSVTGIHGKTTAADEDLAALEREMIGHYGRVIADELHRADANHLNLGMRYSTASKKTMGADLSCFDVFSINCYGADPVKKVSMVSEACDMPVISGEWHIGAVESGLPAPGIWYAETQAERAAACRYYIEQAVSLPNLVGAHYFEYNDQPYFGRFDGECYQIGFSDVCHKPYRALCETFTDFAHRMYPMLDGELQSAAEPAKIFNY